MNDCYSSQPKKKKKPKPQTETPVDPAPADSTPDAECSEALNGFYANGSAGADGDSLDSLSEQLDSLDAADLDSEAAAPELSDATGTVGDECATLSFLLNFLSVLLFDL